MKIYDLLHSEGAQLLETEVKREPVSDVALVIPVHRWVVVIHVVRGQPVSKLGLCADVGAKAEVRSVAAYDGVVFGESHVTLYKVSALPGSLSGERNSLHLHCSRNEKYASVFSATAKRNLGRPSGQATQGCFSKNVFPPAFMPLSHHHQLCRHHHHHPFPV